jgi:hypothetical protein
MRREGKKEKFYDCQKYYMGEELPPQEVFKAIKIQRR